MKKNLIYAAIVAASAGLTLACTSSYTESTSSVQGESQSGGMPKVSDYPETKTVTQQDNYHGKYSAIGLRFPRNSSVKPQDVRWIFDLPHLKVNSITIYNLLL